MRSTNEISTISVILYDTILLKIFTLIFAALIYKITKPLNLWNVSFLKLFKKKTRRTYFIGSKTFGYCLLWYWEQEWET